MALAVAAGAGMILGIATTGDPAKIEDRRYAEAADTTVPGGAYAGMAWGGLDDYRVLFPRRDPPGERPE